MSQSETEMSELERLIEQFQGLQVEEHREDAVKLLYRILALAEAHQDLHKIANAHLDLGRNLIYHDPDRSYLYLKQALDEFEKLGNPSGFAAAHGVLGNLHRVQCHSELADSEYQAALKIIREIGEKPRLLNVLGNYTGFLFENNRISEAQIHVDEAIALSRELGNRSDEIWLLTMSAKELQRAFQADLAKTRIEEAITLAKLNNIQSDLMAVYEGKSYIHMMNEEYPAACESLEKVIDYFDKTGNKRYLSVVYGNLGESYLYSGRFEESQKCLDLSIDLARDYGDRRCEGNGIVNKADLCLFLQDFEAAYHLYLEALDIYRNLKMEHLEAQILLKIGRMHLGKGESLEAMAVIKQATAIFQQLSDQEYLALSRCCMVDCLLAENLLDDAYKLIKEVERKLDDTSFRLNMLNYLLPKINLEFRLARTQMALPSKHQDTLSSEMSWREAYQNAVNLIERRQLIRETPQVQRFFQIRKAILASGLTENDVPEPKV